MSNSLSDAGVYPLIVMQGAWHEDSLPLLLHNLSVCRQELLFYEVIYQHSHSLAAAHQVWSDSFSKCTHLLVVSTSLRFPTKHLGAYFHEVGDALGVTLFRQDFSMDPKPQPPSDIPLQDTVVCLGASLLPTVISSPVFSNGTFYHNLSAYIVSNTVRLIQGYSFSLRVYEEIPPLTCAVSPVEDETLEDNSKLETQELDKTPEELEKELEEVNELEKELDLQLQDKDVKEPTTEEVEEPTGEEVKEPTTEEVEEPTTEEVKQPTGEKEEVKPKRRRRKRENIGNVTPLRRSSRISENKKPST